MRYTPGELSKALITLALGVATVLGTALSDARLDGIELLGVVVVLLNGLVVFKVQNMSEGVLYWKKAICSTLGTGVAVLVTSLSSNVEPGASIGAVFAAVTAPQWYALLFAVLTGVMTAVVPNAAASDGLIQHINSDNYVEVDEDPLTPEEEALLPNPKPDNEPGK